MERKVTAAMIQIILSLCIFNWNLILTFRYLSEHSEITLISADDHGCLLLNPRVPVQVSLSENKFLFLHFPFPPYDWKAYFRNVILSQPFPTHTNFYLQALYGICKLQFAFK